MTGGAERQRYTALVLAGTRPGGDPLARALGVSHKCLIQVEGRPMISRVFDTLSRSESVGRIVASIEDPRLLMDLRPEVKGMEFEIIESATSPSESAANAIAHLDGAFPILITTADHPLLSPELVEQFCREAEASAADIVAGLATASVIQAAYPETRRTYLKLSDGQFSGCNLFALMSPAGVGAVRLWRRVERERKRPWRLAKAFGPRMLFAYLLGRLSLSAAMAEISRLAGAKVSAAILPIADAAVDVDKAEDLRLVEDILRARA